MGSLAPCNFVRILDSVDGGIYGKFFFDAGCGFGEMEYSHTLLSGQTRLGISPAKTNLGFCDISKMVSIQHNPDLLFTFWESMNTQACSNILKITSCCLSVTVFACTNAPGKTIEAVCSTLNKSSPGGGKAWKLADNISTTGIGACKGRSGYSRKNQQLVKECVEITVFGFLF